MKCIYKKARGAAGNKGVEYQINLSTVFLLNALQKLTDWRLSTENTPAGKFDDIVLELADGTAILLQAKHKENKKVTLDQLLSTNSKNDYFSLPKYFFSYQEIKSKFPVRLVILCTNTRVEGKILKFVNRHEVSLDGLLHYENDICSYFMFNDKILPDLLKQAKIYRKNNSQGKHVDEATISVENVKDFLNHLQFYSDYPTGNDMGTVIENLLLRLKRCDNLWYNTSFQDIHNKVKNWFQNPKGEYLTESRTRALFCEIKSDKYYEILENYNVLFEPNDLVFPESKRIFHIITDHGYLCHTIKIHCGLKRAKQKILYAPPDDGTSVQKHIIEAFECPSYTFLVIVWPVFIKEAAINEVCAKLTEILRNYAYKKVVLVADNNNKLVHWITSTNEECKTIKCYVTLADLSDDTQNRLLKKKSVIFQGDNITLEELLGGHQIVKDYKKYVNSEDLEALIRDEKIIMGTPVSVFDEEFSRQYINRRFKRETVISEEINEMREETFPEEDIYEVNEKMILISDTAGMGKSTVLTNLATTIKRKYPHLWVVKIELNNCTKIFRESLKMNRTVGLRELLDSQEATRTRRQLETIVFSLKGKVVLMLDGVDEVSPDYTSLVVHLLFQCQQRSNFAKVFITTRPYMSRELKGKLQVFPFTLEPFTAQNQIDFLTRYWSHNLDIEDADRSRCERYAKALIRKMSTWIKVSLQEQENQFAAIPLHLRILAEIFQENHQSAEWEGCREYLEVDGAKPKLPDKMNIATLYEMFIEKKRDIFVDKGNPSGNTAANRALRNEFDKSLDLHRHLALRAILGEARHQLFLCSYENGTDAESNILHIGIVQKVEDNFRFVHKTFAEYFVAGSIIKELQNGNTSSVFHEFLFNSVCLNAEFHLTRAFFDGLLQSVVHTVSPAMFRDYKSVDHPSHWSEQNNFMFFHKMAEEGCVAILQLVFKITDYKPLPAGKQSHLKQLHKAFFEKNTSTNTLNVLHFLLHNGGVDIKDGTGLTPLHMSVQAGHFDTSKYLVEQGANIRTEDRDGNSVLYHAVLGNEIRISTYLLENTLKAGDLDATVAYMAAYLGRSDVLAQAYVHSTIRNGQTLIFAAVHGGQIDTIKSLLLRGVDVNSRDDLDKTALNLAVENNKLDIVRFLVNHGGDVDNRNCNGRTALHSAASLNDRLEAVKLLVKLGTNVNSADFGGRTPLHDAAEWGHLDILSFLVENGGDIHATDKDSNTTLHLAASRGQLDVVLFLLEHKADVNCKRSDGRTVLHLAATAEGLSTMYYLQKIVKDVNERDNADLTALHLLVRAGQLEAATSLIACGADINIKDKNGRTALHSMVKEDDMVAVVFLVENGVDINGKDNCGRTPLHLAIENVQLHIIELLLKLGADINIVHSDGRTALYFIYLAVEAGRLDPIKFLISFSEYLVDEHNIKRNQVDVRRFLRDLGVDVGIGDNFSPTALDLAAMKGRSEVVEFLVGLGVDVNLRDNAGFTALHLAASAGQLDTVKLLRKLGIDVNSRDNDGRTALHTCALKSQWGIVKYLVETGAEVNVSSNNGKTLLHLAAESGEGDIFSFLVQCGADINVKDTNGETASILAKKKGHSVT